MDALNKLKVTDLRKMLKEKGLNTDGTKPNLVKRLLAAGDKSSSDSETNLENVDLDEDLILGNDGDNDDSIETMTTVSKSEPSVTTAVVMNSKATQETTSSVAVSAIQSQPKSAAANGKMEERIKRFGVVAEDVKKKARADRFQVTSSDDVILSDSSSSSKLKADVNKSGPSGDKNILLKRKERFSGLSDVNSSEKPTEGLLKKRAERFGSAVPATTDKADQSDLLKKRAERFGMGSSTLTTKGDDENMLLKRKERFSSLSDANSSEAKKAKSS